MGEPKGKPKTTSSYRNLSSMSEAVLEVFQLRTTFHTKLGDLHAVKDLSYNIQKGELLGIVGESGCGKSVASLSVMGLLEEPGEITKGKILFQKKNLLSMTEKQRNKLRGKKMSMIFQEPMTALNPVMTIGKQIGEGLQERSSLKPSELKDRVVDMINKVGLPDPLKRYDNYPHQLSGGMRQRAMIAMAFLSNPELLIADEPTTALDVTIQAQILELIQNLQKTQNTSIQFITHDLGVISEIADRVLVMYAGRACEISTTDEIFNSPQHPYTIALLESIPHINKAKAKKLFTIKGQVPSLFEEIKGCPFQNRCPKKSSLCHSLPPLEKITDTHSVACFHRGKA